MTSDKKRLLWVVSDLDMVDGRASSSIASVRVRCLNFCKAIGGEYDITIFNIRDPKAHHNKDHWKQFDIVVFGKIFEDYSKLYRQIKLFGGVIVADVCDNFVQLDHLVKPYEALLTYADKIVTASQELKALLSELDLDSIVVQDCLDHAQVTPRYGSNDKGLELLWYGSRKSLQEINSLIHLAASCSMPNLNLTLVSSFTEQEIEGISESANRVGVSVKILQWQQVTLQQELVACDVVVLPAAANKFSTHNRVTTALMAGKYVIAQPIPAYIPFTDFIALGDLSDGLGDFIGLADRCALNGRISAAQNVCLERFGAETIAQQWRDIFDTVLDKDAYALRQIKLKITNMGKEYSPGNASKEGYLYNPIPFPEFDDVPYQRGAVESRFKLLAHNIPNPYQPYRLLDLGCHTGFNCYRFNEFGLQCTGIELEPLTAEIAQDVAAYKRLPITFLQGEVTESRLDELGHFDVILCLSVFQWIVYFQGFEKALEILKSIQRHCDILYFETSMGTEGKFKLPQIPTADSIEAMLNDTGIHDEVVCIGWVKSPGSSKQPRYVFRSMKSSRVSGYPVPLLSDEIVNTVQDIEQEFVPVKQKENQYFWSAFYSIAAGEDPMGLKVVTGKDVEPARLLYREHEFISRINHPGVVRVLGTRVVEDTYFQILEWLDGWTLEEYLEQHSPGELPLNYEEQLDAIEAALKCAGIRHNDIWERNLMITRSGELKLIDFGWACWESEAVPLPPELRFESDAAGFAHLRELRHQEIEPKSRLSNL